MHLSTNMRVHSCVGTLAGKPADVLLKNGSGSIPISSMVDYIQNPPESGNVVDTIEKLKAEFFSALHKNLNAQWLCERAILAPRNDCVAHVNNQLLDDFPGDVVVYKSIDTVPDLNAVTDPTKFLNSLELSGMPHHILKLKVGAPVRCCKISIYYTSTMAHGTS